MKNSCVCASPTMTASTEVTFHTWTILQRNTLELLRHLFPNVEFFTGHHADDEGDHRSLANIWSLKTPAQGWAGRVHQKPVVWLIQQLRHVRAETGLLGVYCKSCQTCSVSRNDSLALSVARFRSPWEVSSKQDSTKSSQDAWRGWGASRSYTLIGVNSDLSHIACKLMGIGILGHFKEPR